MDEGLEDRVLDDLRHVSYILQNTASFFLKIYIMHIFDSSCQLQKVRSSSGEVSVIPSRKSYTVSSVVQLWESKMMQSKAMEDFRKNNINSSNFVLQLPANYSQTDQEVTGNPVCVKLHQMISVNTYVWHECTYSEQTDVTEVIRREDGSFVWFLYHLLCSDFCSQLQL